MMTETIIPAERRPRKAKAEPSAADWLERIQAAEKTLADARIERGGARTQLEWLGQQREHTERLITQRRLYLENPDSSAQTADFWELHSEAALAERLRRVHEGGAAMPTARSVAYVTPDGTERTASAVQDAVLPSLEELTARVADLEKQVAAAEVALREAKRDGYQAIEADAKEKEAAFQQARGDAKTLRGDLALCADVDQAMAMRSKLDQSPLRLIAAERAAVAAKVALCDLGDPATEAEVAAADAAIKEADAAFKAAAAGLQAAKMARLALMDRATDSRAEKNALRMRLNDLEGAWQQSLQSKDVRSLV